MPKATKAQKMRLAMAALVDAQDELRGPPPDPETRANLDDAFLECRNSYADVARLVKDLCPAEDWPGIEYLVDAFLQLDDDIRRDNARLRSERARRARGVMPRQKAKQPWLAAGVSRSTWYRRQKKPCSPNEMMDLATARMWVAQFIGEELGIPLDPQSTTRH
jgi:hypothetical protein